MIWPSPMTQLNNGAVGREYKHEDVFFFWCSQILYPMNLSTMFSLHSSALMSFFLSCSTLEMWGYFWPHQHNCSSPWARELASYNFLLPPKMTCKPSFWFDTIEAIQWAWQCTHASGQTAISMSNLKIIAKEWLWREHQPNKNQAALQVHPPYWLIGSSALFNLSLIYSVFWPTNRCWKCHLILLIV